MKKFPLPVLETIQGTLSALIFENSFINLAKTLFFKIEIPLKPIDMTQLCEDITDENYQTSLHLDWIKFNINNLQELENKTFTFPLNPEVGYIDGSIYLFDVHNMIYTKSITFGGFKNAIIPVKISLCFDFAMEGTGFAKTEYTDIFTELVLGELSILDDVFTANEENLKTAETFLAQYINVKNLNKPFLGDWGITSKMKI